MLEKDCTGTEKAYARHVFPAPATTVKLVRIAEQIEGGEIRLPRHHRRCLSGLPQDRKTDDLRNH